MTEPVSKSLEATEELGRDGATAPRIDLDFIKSQIEHSWFRTLEDIVITNTRIASLKSLRHITICVLLMKSGFVVVGKSAPLSPANFDAEKGRTFAYEDAIRQLWPMFAFHWLQKQ